MHRQVPMLVAPVPPTQRQDPTPVAPVLPTRHLNPTLVLPPRTRHRIRRGCCAWVRPSLLLGVPSAAPPPFGALCNSRAPRGAPAAAVKLTNASSWLAASTTP